MKLSSGRRPAPEGEALTMNPTLPWNAGSKSSALVATHENSHQGRTSSLRWLWLLGSILLLGSALGTGWALRGSSGPVEATNPAAALPPGIVCIGFVDVEAGVAALYPLQPGRIVKVVAEGTEVRKGNVLLSLDHELADYRVKEAEADLEAAQNAQEQASKMPEQNRRKQEQQKAAVAAARHTKGAADQEFAIKAKLHKEGSLSLQEKLIAQEMVQRADALVQAEESKLAELDLFDPQIGVRRAAAAVKAKEAQLAQARFARRECDLCAPCDGKVLRVFVHLGEVLGTAPKQPALQFCPSEPRVIRAEVLQEWASRVRPEMPVLVEDDTSSGTQWPGKVKSVSDWYTQKRHIVLEPMVPNDVRTLECVVEVNDQGKKLRIGQRVRVTVLEKGKT